MILGGSPMEITTECLDFHDFEIPTQVYAYTIQSQSWRFAQRAPKDWTLQTSHDNTNWTVIDTVSGESGWARWETRRFDVESLEATDITS